MTAGFQHRRPQRGLLAGVGGAALIVVASAGCAIDSRNPESLDQKLRPDAGGDTPTCKPESNCVDNTCRDGACDSGIASPCTTNCETSVCGNGIVEGEELCDPPGGVDPGGACTPDCRPAACGDGYLQRGVESCDPLLVARCTINCTLPPVTCGNGVPDLGEACEPPAPDCTDACAFAVCGNGVREATESCDPPDGTTCNPQCAKIICGDGIVGGLELCDDGVNAGGYGGCQSNCTLGPRCGDGVVQAGAGETCDDGVNAGSYGGCEADCTLAAHCGDGELNPDDGEACDDGELVVGMDGCDTNCTFSRGLLVWYPFDEPNGSTIADALGNHDAQVQLGRRFAEAPPFEEALRVPGKNGTALHFQRLGTDVVDPTDEAETQPKVYANLNNLVPDPSAATIALWLRMNGNFVGFDMVYWAGTDGNGAGGEDDASGPDFDPHHEVYMRATAVSDTTFEVLLGSTPSFLVDIATDRIPRPPGELPTTTNPCSRTVSLPLNEWNHLAMTFQNLSNPGDPARIVDVTNFAVYVNGQQVFAEEGCHSINVNRVRAAFLGRVELASNDIGIDDGDIDDFMLFDRVLTPVEVNQLFAAQDN
jgi:cysteine-rich repeat protein